ncbi:MAG: SDR family NAD(P)-dependent oxidoreductase [Pseudomonadota bacterium]
MNIENNVFIVTGGASGLGEATVRLLAETGGKVVIVDTNAAAGVALAEELGANVRFAHTDITSENDCRAAIALAKNAFGGLRGLINCAGIAPGQRLLGKGGVHPIELFSKCVGVNLIGTFNMLRLAAEAMSEEVPLAGGERGVIVSTASAAAFEGQIGQAAYSASKGGLVAMTLPLARELARFGIRVMTVAPGIFETPIMATLPEEAKAALGAAAPFPARLGRAAEFAELVAHIVHNAMLNGEVIRIDGALRLAAR